jgi:predicted ribosome quality control (RQC) complex YloA/Tae2 family protein
MKDEVSALDLYFLVKEFQELISSKVNQIYQLSKKEFLFEFHVPNVGKKMLRIVVPSYLYLTETKGEMPEKPEGFCLHLRKSFKNSRVREINLVDFERIIEIVFEKKEGKKKMFLEFFDKGNLIVCNTDNKISSVLEFQKWTKRIIKPKEIYKYPTKGFKIDKLNVETLRKLVSQSENDSAVKFLATDVGLGGLYAEEVCLKLDMDKKTKLKDLDLARIKKTINDLLKKPKSVVTENKEILPILLESLKSSKYEEANSFNSALDLVLTKKVAVKKAKEEGKIKEKAVGKVEKMLSAQQKQIETMNKKADESLAKGEAIYNNYQIVKSVVDEINKARKKYSWKEIKEKLKNHEIIKKINEKTGKITLELK